MKKLLCLLSALVLVGLVLAAQVSAVSLADQTPGQAAKAMTFPTDGSNHVAVCPVCGKSVTWYALDAATVSAGKTLTKNYHYYLSEDVDTTRDGPLISAAGSTGARCCLHLNGKKLINRGNVALQGAVSRLNVMGDGIVQGARTGATEGATIQINPGMAYGAVVLYGGTYSKVNPGTTANVAAARGNGGVIELHDGATIQAGTAGSAVYLNGEMSYVSAVFRMYGGTLDASATSELAVDMEEDVNKKANKVEFHMAGGTLIGGAAGAVTVRDTTAVYMTGGTIQNGHITIEAGGKMELSGGTMDGGNATNGGNIYIAPGAKLTMTGGTIQNGTATSGGNVYVDQNAVFTMSGGKLLSGSAANGGNVYVGYTGSTIEETPPEFIMTGGSLENGTATKEGGNLYAVGLNAAAKNAKVSLKNATVTGGTATSNGGNMTLNRSTLTMDEGAKILNGTSTGARAGNVRLYIGKIIMNDGLIADGSAKTGATDNIWAYGVSNTYPGSVYMLGGVIDPGTDRHNAGVSLAAYGRLYLANDATFTNVDPQCAAVCVGSSNSNYGKLFICDGWTGFADAYVLDKGYAAGAEVSNSYIQIVKLKDDLTTTVGGSFTGTLVQLYEGTGQFIPGTSSGKLTVANAVLVAQDGKLTATADPLADWAAGEYAYLKLSSNLTIEDLGGQELCVDLNGYDLAVGGSGHVKAFDSQNDNYSAVLCGEITVSGDVTVAEEVSAPNGNRYVALTEDGKTTMHRLDMYLTAVTLRTSAAGLYYKATYKCDKVLEQAVTKYGVVLSVFNMPGADFATETKDINQYTVGTEAFKSGIVTTSGSVFGIMEDGRTAANNSQRGQIKIYANPYVTVGEQTVVGDSKNAGKTVNDEGFDGVAYSLQDAMDTVDSIFYGYDLSDRNQFNGFLETWKNKGMDWQFDNIGDRYAVDNSDLKFSSGNKAYCPVCKKSVTWTAVTQAAYGTTPLGALSNGAHYYLAEDITYTGADATFVRAPGTGSTACLHLNGFDLVATNHTAITGYAGTLNVMGNGTVMGNVTTENQGAAVNINTSGANGKVNLYGGTYTLPQANETAAAVSVYDNGGEINLYEGVTVRGAGGYSVYMGEANLRSAKLGIYGAKVEGIVNCAEPSAAAERSCTLEIGGDAEIDVVKTRSMYVTDRLSGAPKIGLMSMVANVAMELDGLSEGTRITVNTRGTLTAASDRIDEYKKYFTTYVATDSLTVADNALHYEIDYEVYMTPYIRDVSAEAIADGKIHYYFMSSEGMVTSPTAADNIYKWGDSCLIVFPNGETMLVDTGYAMQQPWLIGNLKRMGVGTEENPLDYLLITHPHSDHQGAFYSTSAFFDEISVLQVYHNKLVVSNATTDDYVETVCAARNLPLMDLKRGTELDFGDVHMEVLWPTADMSSTAISSGKINDTSMVFRLDYGEHSSLFTADLYVKGEGDLMAIEDAEKLDVDFLKIPHHGWNTSSSEAFVKAVSPELAVATSFLEMEEQIRQRYVATKTTVLVDVYNGYIHVSADADGNMEYETSR